MILYNTHGYWSHPFVTAADMIRVSDDFGKFLGDYVGDPSSGIHGSCLLASGAVENGVTWDVDCLTEDYWFYLQVRVQE